MLNESLIKEEEIDEKKDFEPGFDFYTRIDTPVKNDKRVDIKRLNSIDISYKKIEKSQKMSQSFDLKKICQNNFNSERVHN